MIIVLDADGVLLDYNQKMADICEKALGIKLGKMKHFHHFTNAANFKMTKLQAKEVFALFDIQGWNSMPAIEGSVEACKALHQAGHQLVCLSSMPERFIKDRQANLLNLGMPVEKVIGSGRDDSETNPKAAHLQEIRPDIFVDDQLRNFQNIPSNICKVWIDHRYSDCPNLGMDRSIADFRFLSLHEFSLEFFNNPHQFKKINKSKFDKKKC